MHATSLKKAPSEDSRGAGPARRRFVPQGKVPGRAAAKPRTPWERLVYIFHCQFVHYTVVFPLYGALDGPRNQQQCIDIASIAIAHVVGYMTLLWMVYYAAYHYLYPAVVLVCQAALLISEPFVRDAILVAS